MSVTLKGLAAAAGVSEATASLAMNDRPGVNAVTRANIQALAKQLGYIPCKNARSLAKKRSGLIGMIVPNISNSNYSSLVQLAENSLLEKGFQMILATSRSNASYERDMIDKQIKYERTMRSIESMRGVMPLAESCGVSLYAEVINRFEHYMLNTAAEGVDYCKQVGSERLKLLLDVFHMNIEEDSFEQAIQAAGRYIGHFHVSEPNRRLPTPGSRVNWGSMGRALRETGYEGSVTMEPILLFLGQTSYNSRLWRDFIQDASMEERNRMLKESLDFVKSCF